MGLKKTKFGKLALRQPISTAPRVRLSNILPPPPSRKSAIFSAILCIGKITRRFIPTKNVPSG